MAAAALANAKEGKTKAHSLSLEGKRLMRDGVDYVNNGRRYDRAFVLLEKAYKDCVRAGDGDGEGEGDGKGCSQEELARICLWAGITKNENLDITDYAKRNRDAIVWYRRGLEHARYVRKPSIIPIRMSLNNSIGVAIHHQHRVEVPPPADSYIYYRRARDIFVAHPEMRRALIRVMKKVESNSGARVVRGGAARGVTARGGGCNEGCD